MGVYGRYVLPKVVHLACGLKPIVRQRQKVVPLACGDVLEIGIGSGLNLRHYDPAKVTRVWGLDPSPEMTAIAKQAARSVPFEVRFIDSPGDQIPLDDRSVDTVLVTYTLCTIPEPVPALREMARVLKPAGTLRFCEHGAAPDRAVRRWQHAVDPVWKRLASGCHLDRDIPALIERGGFTIVDLETMYLPGWRPATFNYWGTARRG